MRKYNSAQIDCPSKVEEVQKKIVVVFEKINQLKEKAVKAENATKTALAETEKQKQIADENLQKANKLIDAFYFAYNRFALAFKDDKFYFIDKNGDKVEKLGEWDKIEQFRGYGDTFSTKVWKEDKEYYLDTMGQSFRMAYRIEDLTPEITALNLSNTQLDSFPAEILANTQLEFLNLGFNNLTYLPEEISKLENLKILYLHDNKLRSLPKALGQLKKLELLGLRDNYELDFNSVCEALADISKKIAIEIQVFRSPEGEIENEYEWLSKWGKEVLSVKHNIELTDTSFQKIDRLQNLIHIDLYPSYYTRDEHYYHNLESLLTKIIKFKNLQSIYFCDLYESICREPLNWEQALRFFNRMEQKIRFFVYDYEEERILLEKSNNILSYPNYNYEENKKRLLFVKIPKSSILKILPFATDDQIVLLKNINSLYISEQEPLPIELSKLTNLKKIHLPENSLLTIPKELESFFESRIDGKLSNYTLDGKLNINLQNRFITTSHIEQLKKFDNIETLNLKSLTLEENLNIKILSDVILNFKSLKNLNLSHNCKFSFNHFISKIQMLENLQSLDLAHNNLTYLNINIVLKLKKLKSLYLNGNHFNIIYLNEILSYFKYSEIKELYLGDLGLVSLSNESIVNLKNLKKLNFKNNNSDNKRRRNLKHCDVINPNNFSKEEQEKIRRLLPNCVVEF